MVGHRWYQQRCSAYLHYCGGSCQCQTKWPYGCWCKPGRLAWLAVPHLVFPDSNVRNSLQRSIINPRFPWNFHLNSLDFPWFYICVTRAQSWKSDTLHHQLKFRAVTVIHYRMEGTNTWLQLSGLKFMHSLRDQLQVSMRASYVDVLHLFSCL